MRRRGEEGKRKERGKEKRSERAGSSRLRFAPTGVSLVEILISVGVLAFALIPVVNLMTTTARSSAFTEFHVFWQIRSSRILEKFRQYDYPALKQLSRTRGTLPIQFAEPPIPLEYGRMLRNWKETCRFEEIRPGLARLTVTIEWSFPMDRPGGGGRAHKMTLNRLVADPTLSWKCRDALRLEAK